MSTAPASAPPRRPSPAGEGSLLRRGAVHIGRVIAASPRYFALGGVSAALFAAMTIASSVVLGRITDRVILPAFADGEIGTGALAGAAALVLGVGLVKAVGVVGRRYGAYLAMFDLQRRTRTEVTQRYLDLPLTWHRRHATGTLMSNANSDVEEAYRVSAPLPMALAATLLLILASVLLVLADPVLAAIGFAVLPTLAVANLVYQRRMRDAAAAAQTSRADVSRVAHESFDAALVIKTLGRERVETERFEARNDVLRDRMIRVGRLRGTFDPVLEALPNLGILAVLLVGVGRVEAGALTAGDLVQFAYLFQLLAIPMRAFGWVLGDLPRGIVGMDRIDRVRTATGDQRYGEVTEASGPGGASLDLDAVTYRHPVTAQDAADGLAGDDPAAAVAPAGASPHRAAAGAAGPAADAGAADPAADPGAAGPNVGSSAAHHSGPHGDGTRGVADVELHLEAGEVLAVVGPTGSGKSTLAELLGRLLDPDTGAVRLDGRALPELARDRLATDVALVFQEAFLFDDTVRENLTLGADVTDAAVETAARLARAHDFVTALPEGYATQVGERGSTLSGGQRQRVALARALLRRPRLLILDDATSAVDPSVETAILTGLADAELPATVVIVAYRLSSIALADRVAFVEDGRVVAVGTHEQLLADQPGYARLVTAYERDERDRHHGEPAAAPSAPEAGS